MNLTEYYDRLEKADWFYEFSDDHSVWKRGSTEFANLRGLAKQSSEHQALFDAFRTHHFSGKPWGTEKQPKPERPSDEDRHSTEPQA